jgi:hypothetical protein
MVVPPSAWGLASRMLRGAPPSVRASRASQRAIREGHELRRHLLIALSRRMTVESMAGRIGEEVRLGAIGQNVEQIESDRVLVRVVLEPAVGACGPVGELSRERSASRQPGQRLGLARQSAFFSHGRFTTGHCATQAPPRASFMVGVPRGEPVSERGRCGKSTLPNPWGAGEGDLHAHPRWARGQKLRQIRTAASHAAGTAAASATSISTPRGKRNTTMDGFALITAGTNDTQRLVASGDDHQRGPFLPVACATN